MWYRLILAYREVGKGGEKTIHKTKGKYDRPIFVMDTESNSDPSMSKGTGSKVFGPGHYTSQNKVVSYGYEYPYTRVEKLPQGTRILDLDRIPNFHAKRIIKSLDPEMDENILESDLYRPYYTLQEIIEFTKDHSKNPDVKKYRSYDHGPNYRQIYPKLIELGYDAVEYFAGRNFSLDSVLSRINARPEMLETEKQRKRRGKEPFVKSKRFQRRINKLEKQIDLSAVEFENLLGMFKRQYGENWIQNWKPVSTRQENIDRLFEKNIIDEEEKNFLLETNLQKKNVLVINATTLMNPKLFQKERFRPETLSEEEKKELDTLKKATSYDVTKHILSEMKKKDPENWIKNAYEDFTIDPETLIKLVSENIINPLEAVYLGGNSLGVSDFTEMLKNNIDIVIENFDFITDLILSRSLDEKKLLSIYTEAQKYQKSPDFSKNLIKTFFFKGKIEDEYILKHIMPFLKIGFFSADDLLNNKFYFYGYFKILDENYVSELDDMGITVDQMKNMDWRNFHLYNNINGLLEIGFDKEFLIKNISNAKSPTRLKNIGFDYIDIIGQTDFDSSDINLHVFIDGFLQENDEEITKTLSYEQKLQILEVKIATLAVKKLKDFRNRFTNFLKLSSLYDSKDILKVLFKNQENFAVYNEIVSDPKPYVTKSNSNIDLKEKIITELSEEYQPKFDIFSQIKETITRLDQKYFNGLLFCDCGYIKLETCPNCGNQNSYFSNYTNLNFDSCIEILKELLPLYRIANGDQQLLIYFEGIEKITYSNLRFDFGSTYSLNSSKITWKQSFPEITKIYEIYKILKDPNISDYFKYLHSERPVKELFALIEDPEFIEKNDLSFKEEDSQINQTLQEDEEEEPINIDDDED